MSATEVIERFLADRQIAYQQTAPDLWALQLAGEHKKTIGAGIALTDSGARFESFFMRAPNENAGEVCRLLLGRNARARHVWFAADGMGDLYLVGFVSRAAVTEGVLDEVLGELLTTADQMFDVAMQRGFASYLAADLAWRAKQHDSG